MRNAWLGLILVLPGCGGGEANQEEETGGVELGDHNPAWSPDGSMILFTSTEGGGGSNENLWRMKADGTGRTQLTFSSEHSFVNMPGAAWNAVANRICYSSDLADNDEIWTALPDGTNGVRLTNHPAADWEPTWSPDGQWIVFQSNRSGNWEIWKMRSDGSNLVQLTSHPADDWEPNWSPMGDKIVFQSLRSGNWDIWVMNADGSNLVNVTADPAEDTDPSWSPDGTKIVYASNFGNLEEPEIFVRALLGGVSNRLTFAQLAASAPAYSRDGTKIAYEQLKGNRTELQIIQAP